MIDLVSEREHLRQLIQNDALTQGNFKLASGNQTKYFFNLKPVVMNPIGATLIANAILQKSSVIENTRQIDAFGGMALGAVPIVVAVCMRTAIEARRVFGFYVRKEAKDHGTQQVVEGCLQPGMHTLLLEDVTTTGGSVLLAAQAVKEFGCTVSDVISVVDRLEGAEGNLQQHGITLSSIFSREDFHVAQ